MSSQPDDTAAQEVVVVGYDGSRDSGVAIDWAAMEASRRGARLRLVTAGQAPGVPPVMGFTPAPAVRKAFEDRQRVQTSEAVQRAARHLPETSIDSAVVVERPVVALVSASERASLVVVGHRGRGAISSTLGSVSVAVAERARCPVVVVRGASETGAEPRRPVAVGVDGTPASGPALLFAAESAARWGVPLTVVCAWVMAPQLGWEYGAWQAPSMEGWHELAQALSTTAREAAESAAGDARAHCPGLRVEAQAPELSPAAALEEASRTSSQVVVGASGSSALGGFLLGSVSRSVLHHAACPVAVVKVRS